MPDHPPPFPRVVPVGDAALLIELGDTVNPAINAAVLALDARIRAMDLPGVVELVPTYRSLLVHYDPEAADGQALLHRLAGLDLAHAGEAPSARIWTVPVAYGGDYGIDLEAVAARHGLTPEQAVEIFEAVTYRVYMIGFAPGLAYLGGLDPRLHTPRLDSPRLKTPAGSVAIGGVQAAIFPIDMPSGWHLLGRTPVRAFDPDRDPPFLFSPGDLIRFTTVRPDAFDALAERAASGDPLITPDSGDAP